jgi:fatty-acyl-CoA synthase
VLLHDLVDRSATDTPDAAAVSIGATTMTFGALAARVARVAAVVEALTDPGDRVAVIGENSLAWVECYYAVPRAGRVLVFLNHRLAPQELHRIVARSGATLLIGAAGSAEHLIPGAGSIPSIRTILDLDRFDALVQRAVPAAPVATRADDPAWIIYTSGTTGSPKGATLTHFNIVNNGFFVGEALRLTAADRLCIPVPLYHCFGMVLGVLAAMTHGAASVFPGQAFEPLAVLDAVERERCTALHGVPTMFIAELEHPRFRDFDLSSLRTGIMAGSPCPIAVMRRVVEEMHMPQVTICYGMT